MILIKLLSEPSYIQSFNLDGVDYRLQFKLNTRENQYYLSVYDSSGILLLSGVKIVKETPLITRFKRAGMPPGEFIAFSPAIKDKVGEDDFKDKLEFYYITEQEIKDLISG